MSSHEKKAQNMDFNKINNELNSIIDIIIEDEIYEEGKNKIKELFKSYISNEKIINLCLTIINNIIILKGNSKYKILSSIPEICEINPKSFFTHVDIILSIFQSCLTEDNSPFYSQISQYFGDTVKVLLNELNSENYNTYIIDSGNHQNMKNNLNNQKNLFLVYTKFKLFCLSNIKSDNNGCQICGTLCLTSFIENCSFNYTNNENLKCIFDNLCMQINNPNFPGKLEILNCFISLVFSSEEKYVPYSTMTLNVIIQFIKDPEWLIRKFSLNIIYTMLYYCKKEIIEKKDFIIENLRLLKYETNIEVKEIADQIYKIINEENPSYNNRIVFLSDSLFDSNNSKFSSGEQSKSEYMNNFPMNNRQYKICEEEKNSSEISKSDNKKNAPAPKAISKKKFQNSFVKNSNNNKNYKFDNSQTKQKLDKKRKANDKFNDIMKDNYINNSSSRKLFLSKKKNPNHNNSNLNNSNNEINSHIYKKRNVFSDTLANKSKNNKIPPSRNSVDRFYGLQKKNPISMFLKKKKINKDTNNITTDIQNIRIKQKENFGFNSQEKTKKIIDNIRQKNKNLSHKKISKKLHSINNIKRDPKIYNLKSNDLKTQQIKGRNEIKKHANNNLISSTMYDNNISVNSRNPLSLNKIPSFGPGSEDSHLKPLYPEENSEYMEEVKSHEKNYDKDYENNIALKHDVDVIKNKNKLTKLKNLNNHNNSFENQKIFSKKNFLNRSVENNYLNFSSSGHEESENHSKIQNTAGNIDKQHNQNSSNPKVKKINPLFQKYEKSLNNKIKKISQNRNNNSQKNNKFKRITKLNRKRMTAEVKSDININNIKNINNFKNNIKTNHINNKYKLSPNEQIKNSLEIHKLFHSFSNNEKETIKNKNENNQPSKIIIKNDSKKMNNHKANHSLQMNNINNKNVNSKIKSKKGKKNTNSIKNNKKIQIQRKSINSNINSNSTNKNNHENKNFNKSNNNINNQVISLSEDQPLGEIEIGNNGDLNEDLKNDESIELKFKEYKNETSKIINDLKLQVNFLKTTLGNFEETTKQKEKLNNCVKNKDFAQAFETAVEIGNIQDVYYVIKKYQLFSEQEEIPSKTLDGIMKILCEDILSCENLRLITMFIIKNICEKKIIFEKDLNKEIFNVFIDLYNKRKELCLMKTDVTNILRIANYFSKGS